MLNKIYERETWSSFYTFIGCNFVRLLSLTTKAEGEEKRNPNLFQLIR